MIFVKNKVFFFYFIRKHMKYAFATLEMWRQPKVTTTTSPCNPYGSYDRELVYPIESTQTVDFIGHTRVHTAYRHLVPTTRSKIGLKFKNIAVSDSHSTSLRGLCYVKFRISYKTTYDAGNVKSPPDHSICVYIFLDGYVQHTALKCCSMQYIFIICIHCGGKAVNRINVKTRCTHQQKHLNDIQRERKKKHKKLPHILFV